MTLEELDYTNDQQVFNFIVEKMISSGKCFDEEEGCCKYRANNNKCAVGHIIKDEDYTADFEGLVVSDRGSLIRDYCSNKGVNLYLLSDLQSTHDRVSMNKWGEITKEFEEIATNYSLVYNP
jgi:hypothetical protein